MKERIALTVVLWIIKRYLDKYHLSKNPVRKKNQAEN